MRHLSFATRSIHAAGAVLLVITPLLAAFHVLEVDHDGRTQHIETSHGDHYPAVADADRHMPSPDLRLSFNVIATSVAWAVSDYGVERNGLVAQKVGHPSRAPPPGSLRSRAPPGLS